MAKYTTQEYVDMLLTYGFCDTSVAAAEREYTRRFPDRRIPNRRTILSAVQRIRETGSILPKSGKEAYIRRRMGLDDAVLDIAFRNPTLSLREIARRVHAANNTVREILQENAIQPMCKKNVSKIDCESSIDEMEDASDTSDEILTDSESEQNENLNMESTETDLKETILEEDEEDETIKAIIRESNRERDHPPSIQCEDFVTDISFHPHGDIIAVSNIVGDVLLYKYSNEENTLISTLELHTKACRDIEFSHDGKILFSTSKDKSVMLSDVDSGKLIRFYEQAHEAAVYSLCVIDENLFSTGDDDGTVKIWDMRERGENPIYKTRKNEDYISHMITNESKEFLICSSGDGSLTTIDLQNRKIFMQSEEYEEELTCLGLFRNETKLVSGSSKGKLFIYNWKEFGLHSDTFPGQKSAITDLIPITENIVVTACEDGNLRATHLFPHKHLGIVGQHDMPVENVDICNTGQFIASSSHNNDVKFWNIQYFEDIEKANLKQKNNNKRKEMRNNLPSSEIKNASDFFSDLS